MRFSGIINLFFPVLVACGGAGAVMIYRQLRTWELRDRWLAAAILPATIVWCGSVLRITLAAPFDFWESLRLLPAYLLAGGIPLYCPPHSGPVLDMMYGPITAVAYWPITLVAHRPDLAAMGAKALTIAYYFLPALWLMFRTKDRNPRSRVMAGCLILGFAFYSLESNVLRGSAYGNHSDAPALGLAALSCIFLLCRTKENPWPWILASTVSAVLSAWTKQVTAPLLLALPLYVWLADGPRAALRYFGCMCLVSGVSLVIFSLLFDARNMFFNLVVHPSSEPWENHLMKVQGRAIVELLAECRWMLMVLLFYVVYETRPSAPKRGDRRHWLSAHDYGLFFWVGIFMIPTSIMGRLKIAGALNALSYSVYFFALAVGLLFIEIVSTPEPFPHDRVAKGLVKVGTLFLLASAVLIRTPTQLYYFTHLSQALHDVRNNPLKQGYLYAKSHPGEVYLPRNPLVTYMAEGKLYHFDFAVGEREVAGYPISPDHFRQYIPANIRWVAYAPDELDEYILRFLPEFYKRIELPELPGWKVYSRAT